MKNLIAATLATLLLGVSAASAAPFYGPMHGPFPHREVVRYFPGHHHVWMRGERFMPSYARYVMVDDWRAFHLRRPPFGFHWVRVGGDFLMVGNRDGIVADVIFSRY